MGPCSFDLSRPAPVYGSRYTKLPRALSRPNFLFFWKPLGHFGYFLERGMLIKHDWGWEGKVRNVFHFTSCFEPDLTLFYSLLCNQGDGKEMTSDLSRKCELVWALGKLSCLVFLLLEKCKDLPPPHMCFSTDPPGNRTVNLNIAFSALSYYWATMGIFPPSLLFYLPPPYPFQPFPHSVNKEGQSEYICPHFWKPQRRNSC